MSTDSPLYIDNSTLRALAGCDLEAVLRYGWNYATREERAMLLQGNAGHEALASYLRGDTVLEPDENGEGEMVSTPAVIASEVYRRLYKQWSDDNLSPDDRLTWENTDKIINAWMERHPIDALPFYFTGPEFVEIGFAFPLTREGDIIYCGRMDGLPVDRTSGLIALVEHKFTGRISPDWLKTFKLDSQCSGYLWAAQEHLGDANVLAVYLNAIETSMVPGSDKKCPKHHVAYAECGPLEHVNFKLVSVTRTPEEIAHWKTTAIDLARRYRDILKRFPTPDYLPLVKAQGKFHGRCRFCGFYDFCAGGRQAHEVPILFTESKWDPLAYAQAEQRTGTGIKP